MVTSHARSLILGTDKRWTKRWILVAAGLLLASFGFFAGVKAADSPPTILVLLWWEGYAVLLVGFIAVQAYSNEGVVASWALAFAAVVGVILNYGGIALAGPKPGILRLAELAILGGLIAAALLGTLGFVIGITLRRITM